jgi:hypothetical protein
MREPDCVIGPPDNPYLRRWWLIPRNRWFNLYLHNILRDDDDRALHDHPWANLSILLRGAYREVTPRGTHLRKRGSFVPRSRARSRVDPVYHWPRRSRVGVPLPEGMGPLARVR